MAVAFITGGAGAIGRACAWALVRDGWKVVLADIDEEEVQRVAANLGGQAIAWLLSDEASHVTGACIDVSGGTTLH